MMKAAVFEGLDKPLAIKEVPTPTAGRGEVVIKVDYCGICGSDLHATKPGVFLVADGTVLGHEFSGEVVDSGSPDWKVGDRATAVPNNACADCRSEGLLSCKNKLGIMCPKNAITGFSPQFPGAYAEYVKFTADEAVRLPPEVDPIKGATVEPLSVGYHAVLKGGVRIGDRVLVIGAGPIGIAVTLFARLAGARAVVVSEYAPARREAAGKSGASGVIDPAAEDVAAAFARIAGGPPDVIFECVGVAGLLQKTIDLSRTYGRVVVVGVCMTEDTVVPLTAIFKEISFQFILGYQRPEWDVVLDLLQSGKIDPTPLITDVIGFDELPKAFEALRRPSSQIKVLIKPS
jgi:(R,R)-butanediol dehydrogenase/meso-butanediol dehydrogenase/diacetyl reductase